MSLFAFIACLWIPILNHYANASPRSPLFQLSTNETNNTSDSCLSQAGNNSDIKCESVPGKEYPVELTSDKYLFLRNTKLYIPPASYCITQNSTSKLCPSLLQHPWRKCCPQDHILHLASSPSCISTAFPFRLSQTAFIVTPVHRPNFTCPAGYSLRRFSSDKCGIQSVRRLQLSPNGAIQYELPKGVFLRKSEWNAVDPTNPMYCLDGGVTQPNTGSNCNYFNTTARTLPKSFSGKQPANEHINTGDTPIPIPPNCGLTNLNEADITSVLFICIEDDHTYSAESIRYKTATLAVLWLLTCPLLVAAAIGNSCIIQKNVHGWILTCYLLSMCVLNVLSAIVIWNVGRSPASSSCKFVDFFIKFMYMSTLCWMSSINFGLHKTFRCTLPQPVRCRRFIKSALFSWGVPGISVAICYFVAYFHLDKSCGSLAYCMLFHPVTIPFYSVPMLLLVLGNFAIFVKTSYTISKMRKETQDVLQHQVQDHLKSFALFAKLFLLSGCVWLLRVGLFILQVKGLYLSWYGVVLEMIFSIPEVVFPLMIFHHPEFIRWCWNSLPTISNLVFKINPIFNVTLGQ